MNLPSDKAILPFLKWAGGKRWLIAQHPEIFPTKIGRYIEPFLGSGAVFFSLSPEEAILSDLNPELIRTYRAIKTDWKKVARSLQRHHKLHNKKYYYLIREKDFECRFERAARFIYLNRTCWNGLYRVNRYGKFNVPKGTRSTVVLETDNFAEISRRLKKAKLLSGDFEQIIDEAKKGDLIFVDPPYTVKHNFNGFVKYNEKLFSWADQVRLSEALKRAKSRGAKIILTNARHSSISKLYRGFKLLEVSRNSSLAANAKNRGSYDEFVICG